MASSKEAVAQNGEQGSSKVKLEGDALKDAIKKQVITFGCLPCMRKPLWCGRLVRGGCCGINVRFCQAIFARNGFIRSL